MDWIEDNKFLSGWIAVTVIGCVMLTMNLLKARGAYDDAYGRFATARDQVRNLESKPLYPSAENVERKAAAVGAYRAAVRGLHVELAALQRPLRNVEQTALVSKLKQRIQQINRDARRLGVGLPEGFSFGMPQYVNTLPPAELCPLLDYQLDSISSLCSVLLSEKISSIVSIKRQALAAKKPAGRSARGKKQDKEEEAVVRRYPVQIVFKTKPDGLREFLNAVSNPVPGAPFHIVRLVRIANQKQSGPLRGASASAGGLSIPESQVAEVDDFAVSPEEMLDGPGSPEDDGLIDLEGLPGGDTRADEAEAAAAEDAEFVLGREEIEVYVEIELLRLASPKEEEQKEETGSPGGSTGKE